MKLQLNPFSAQTIVRCALLSALCLFLTTPASSEPANNDAGPSGHDCSAKSAEPDSLIIDYLELPGWGHLSMAPSGRSRSDIYPLGDSTYLLYNTVGFDFPDMDDLAGEIRKEPSILYPEAGKVLSEKKVNGKHQSYILFEGKDNEGNRWLAAVVKNRRFQGTEEEASTSAGILFLAGDKVPQFEEQFRQSVDSYCLYNREPRRMKRHFFEAGDYSLEVPENYFVSATYGGQRITAPNGAYLLLDFHFTSEDGVLVGEMEKVQRKIEKGHYNYLFARNDNKIRKVKKIKLSQGVEALRMEASVMLPGPFSIYDSALYYVFSVRRGIGVIVIVGGLTDKNTLALIESSLKVENPLVPLGLDN